MSTRGKIPIAAAAEICRKFKCPVVIIFGVEESGDKFTVTTYGATKKLCRHAADLGDKFAKAILYGRVAPSMQEPLDIPDTPTQADYLTGGEAWWSKHVEIIPNPITAPKSKPVKELLQKTPCTAEELRAILAISPGRVTYCVGIPTKRFAREIQGAVELTEKQRAYLWAVVWRFRRQIKDKELVTIAARNSQLSTRNSAPGGAA